MIVVRMSEKMTTEAKHKLGTFRHTSGGFKTWMKWVTRFPKEIII